MIFEVTVPCSHGRFPKSFLHSQIIDENEPCVKCAGWNTTIIIWLLKVNHSQVPQWFKLCLSSWQLSFWAGGQHSQVWNIWWFFSSRSLKTREKYISLAQFVYFLREVCLLFNFWMIKFTITLFPHIVSAPLCTMTFGLMYCDLWISKLKKNSFRGNYEGIR